MNQHYIDRFHSLFGSNAITILNNFFSASKLYSTDDVCVEYANHMLWHNRFIYLKVRKDDLNVSLIFFSNTVLIELQRWTGAFHVPLILQVFTMYYNITNSASHIEDLKYQLSGGQLRATLLLAATAICHSLLCSTC
jgi:hypothetical protein